MPHTGPTHWPCHTLATPHTGHATHWPAHDQHLTLPTPLPPPPNPTPYNITPITHLTPPMHTHAPPCLRLTPPPSHAHTCTSAALPCPLPPQYPEHRTALNPKHSPHPPRPLACSTIPPPSPPQTKGIYQSIMFSCIITRQHGCSHVSRCCPPIHTTPLTLHTDAPLQQHYHAPPL